MPRQVIAITIVEDGNPMLDDAEDFLDRMVQDGKVRNYGEGSGAMAEPGLTAYCFEDSYEEVRSGLVALHYEVV